MRGSEWLIYIVHTLYWTSFGVARAIARRRYAGGEHPAATAQAAGEEAAAPHSRALVIFHALGFGALYMGIGQAVFGTGVPAWFAGQRLAGTAVIASGAAINAWAVLHFRSWRFRAKLDVGHQLATGGPFAFVRHPIYLALDLLGIGSAVWIPSALVWIGAALMIVGSDLRARAEERLLLATFGEEYRAYRLRTRRFVPGVY